MFSIPVDTNPSAYKMLLPIALILILTKFLSIEFSKIRIPQVIGFLLAGLLIGVIYFIPNQMILTDYTESGIGILAKFGVVLILFGAGIETNLKSIKAVGKASVIITSLGVIVPLALGFLVSFLFRIYGGLESPLSGTGANPIFSDIYYGVILTATSVSITVATLKELGRLDSKVGSAIVSAAILDDIIGIILLSLVISLSGSKTGSSDFNLLAWFIEVCGGSVANPAVNVIVILLNMSIFFVLSFFFGKLIRKFFNYLGTKYPHHIRIPIFSLAFCFLWAYLAQSLFQIADITGAYVAGLVLSSTNAKGYINHRSETTANVFFVPIFFASVALKMYDALASGTSGGAFSLSFLLFGIVWIVVGMLGKIIGAGAGSLISHFNFKDSLRVGIGMMARAEVLIVTAQIGVDAGLVSSNIIPFTLGLILLTSFVTPIVLKLLYKGEPPEISHPTSSPTPSEDTAQATPSDTGK